MLASVKERAGKFFRSLLISRWFSEKNPAGRSTFSAVIANRLPDFIRTSPFVALLSAASKSLLIRHFAFLV